MPLLNNNQLKLAAITFLSVSIFLTQLKVERTPALFNDVESGGMVLSAAVWSSPQNAAAGIVQVLPQAPAGLYALLTEDLQANFSEEDFLAAIGSDSSEILSVRQVGDVTVIDDEWAEFTVEVIFSDAGVKQFLVILHQEAGGWKVWGTEESP